MVRKKSQNTVNASSAKEKVADTALSDVELVDDGLEDNDDLDAVLEFDSDETYDFGDDVEDGLDLGSSFKEAKEPVVRDSLQLYLKEISRFPMLRPEEEIALAQRVRDHEDADAAFKMVSSHLRLVVKIAMDFQRRWMQNVLDLIQEGNVGLMRAVHKFDPDKGIKFSYYASFWIKAYILKFIMDNWRMVKLGTTQAQRKLFYNLNKERQRLIMQGFDPDAASLAQSLGVSEGDVVAMQQRLDAGDMSLDTPLNDETGAATKIDFLPALGPGVEETLARAEIAAAVQERLTSLLPSLSPIEQRILKLRLLSDDPTTLREIGEEFSITRERVRQVEARLLQKISTHLSQGIKDFSQDWIQS